MTDAIGTAAAGARAAAERFAASASRTAAGKGDLASETAERISARTAFNASLAVIRVGDEMVRRLLDIKV